MPELRQIHGDYVEMFGNLFKLQSISSDYQLVPFLCFKGNFPTTLSEYDHFVISGSKYCSFDQETPWILELIQLIRNLSETRQKFVGICFGHQVITIATGGQVIQNPMGWETGPTKIDVDQHLLSDYFGSNCSRTQVYLNEMHRDHVSELGNGFKNFGSTAKGKHQFLLHSDKYLTVQGHPEFTMQYTKDLIAKRITAGVFTNEIVEDLKHGIECDSSWFAELMMVFLLK